MRALVEAWRSWRRFYVRRFLVQTPFHEHEHDGPALPMTDEDIDRAIASTDGHSGFVLVFAQHLWRE
jgi:hypothetical protein